MKRTAEENKRRREIYAIVKKSTGSSKLAAQARDRSVKNITKLSPSIKVREDKRTIYYYIPKKVDLTKERIRLAREKRNLKVKKQRKIARDLNYTPKEAKYLSGLGKKKFDEIIEGKTIINKAGRAKRWAYMSGVYKNGKQRKFDRKIVEECERINLEYGYDIDSRFGWAVYYFYYINGGSIEGWSTYVDQDPNVLHMVAYNQVNQFQF